MYKVLNNHKETDIFCLFMCYFQMFNIFCLTCFIVR